MTSVDTQFISQRLFFMFITLTMSLYFQISGKIRSESGKPGDTIIKTAKQENARLIVIGSRGLSRFKRTFQGSVSDYVLHRASCPVCICRNTGGSESRKGSIAMPYPGSRKGSVSSVASFQSTASASYYNELPSSSQDTVEPPE